MDIDPKPDHPADSSHKAKAVASIATSAALLAGVQLSPENAQIFGTIAALLIPVIPSAYRGIAQIAVWGVNAATRETRLKK